MTQLSPEAQAVLDATLPAYYDEALFVAIGKQRAGKIAAAALRALADQVMPLRKTPWESTLVPLLTARECRDQILAIANDLEAL